MDIPLSGIDGDGSLLNGDDVEGDQTESYSAAQVLKKLEVVR